MRWAEKRERRTKEMNDVTSLCSTLEHSGFFENFCYSRQNEFKQFEYFACKERSSAPKEEKIIKKLPSPSNTTKKVGMATKTCFMDFCNVFKLSTKGNKMKLQLSAALFLTLSIVTSKKSMISLQE